MGQLIQADNSVAYHPKEAAVVVVALAWVIAVGGLAVAVLIVCGWKGAKSASMDFWRGRATISCR